MSDEREQIVLAVFQGIKDGGAVGPILSALGIPRTTWHDWVHSNPEWAERAARARETWAERLVEECPAIAKDKELDAKSRRVIVDTNLKVAALLDPRRFSQAALDRLVAPPEGPAANDPAELAAILLRGVTDAQKLLGPPIDDAEFTEL